MATFSDDFNRADSTSLGVNWVEVSGDWSIISSQLSPGAAGGTIILRAAGAMAGNDHYAQATIAATSVASQGVWCRGNSNISQGYLLRNNGSSWDLFSVVGGSFTVIGTYAVAAAAGDVMKVQAVGTAIKGIINGIERISVTNSAVTTGTSVGIRSDSAGAIRYDDFAAADITGGATLGVASATEAAQALTGTKTGTLTPAVASEAAQTVTGVKVGALPAATASETAQPLAGAKTAVLTPATASEAGQPITSAKAADLSIAGTAETAQALTGMKAAPLNVAGAAEAAQTMSGSKTAVLGIALETATAQPLSSAKVASLPVALQTETAQPLTFARGQNLGTAAVVETAQPLTGAKSAILGAAIEVCAARPLSAAEPDVDGTYIVDSPYTVWAGTVGQPRGSDWGVGEPWS